MCNHIVPDGNTPFSVTKFNQYLRSQILILKLIKTNCNEVYNKTFIFYILVYNK